MEKIKELIPRIENLLVIMEMEDILAESGVTPAEAIAFLFLQGFLELPENEPLG